MNSLSVGQAAPKLRVFSTCPASSHVTGDYLAAVRQTAQWSERAGCEGILVYTDNSLHDPWLVSQAILQCTATLAPLVAVQPVYLHPYSVAKMVTTFAAHHGRRLCLNMVAGGFRGDLIALDDQTPHDQRYDRIVEYGTIILALLRGETVTFEGTFYKVRNLKLTPPLPPALFPLVTVSGSSEAGARTAEKLGAISMEYPKPVGEYGDALTVAGSMERGIRIGIVAREHADDAWQAARQRFPEDRKGQITHDLAMKVSDSSWHRQLSAIGSESRPGLDPYWLVPFENYKTFCPYLVGDYQRVAAEVSRYVKAGYRTIILDVPASPEELRHIGVVLETATAG